ncbi:hypothetical protein [Microbacterium sp. PAMC22086]|uniref:hypothetical protein n=1 Tax=Microbacterium sp. PAMC22086 TaxID=2861281 RepID=UPI0021594181|nr:hypothetical protein [Microbacterium sp. PAMC22086]
MTKINLTPSSMAEVDGIEQTMVRVAIGNDVGKSVSLESLITSTSRLLARLSLIDRLQSSQDTGRYVEA